MSILATVYQQFRQPSGFVGHVAGWIMANRPSNIERNRWTVGLLNVQPTDHVLEIGFGPGLAIAQVARLAPQGRIVGVDHSALMIEQASRRNRSALEAGLVDVKHGGLELLPQLGEMFDKVFSVNVFQFFADQRQALTTIRGAMKPGGLIATTYMPRHRDALPQDADRFAERLIRDMTDLGFHAIRTERLDLKPMPAVCVLGCA